MFWDVMYPNRPLTTMFIMKRKTPTQKARVSAGTISTITVNRIANLQVAVVMGVVALVVGVVAVKMSFHFSKMKF